MPILIGVDISSDDPNKDRTFKRQRIAYYDPVSRQDCVVFALGPDEPDNPFIYITIPHACLRELIAELAPYVTK